MNGNLLRSIRFFLICSIAVFGLSGLAYAKTATTNTIWGAETIPTSQSFFDTFGAKTNNFLDNYSFSTATSSLLSAFVSSIGSSNALLIKSLNISIFDSTTNSFVNTNVTTSSFSGHGIKGTMDVLNPVALGPGSYILEIAGKVKSGGSYSGAMNLSPVPEASVLALLFSGLAFVGFVAYKRNRKNDAFDSRLTQA